MFSFVNTFPFIYYFHSLYYMAFLLERLLYLLPFYTFINKKFTIINILKKKCLKICICQKIFVPLHRNSKRSYMNTKKTTLKKFTIMETYFLVRRASNGRKVVLFESSNKDELLLHFVHSLDFHRLSGYTIYNVVLNGLNSYYLYGNSLFTAKVYIL